MQDNSPQQWQPSDSKVSAPTMPNLPDALTSATAGSKAYMTMDSEQMNRDKTDQNTHPTIAEVCARTSDETDVDGHSPEQGDYELNK